MSRKSRKLWIEHFGEIPKDEEGRPFEIHHKDGIHKNDSIDNLQCISIKNHYKIHYEQGDFGACVLIAKRMALPIDYISNIQKGVKRPGIGGVKKGTIPWNKGISGYTLNLTEEERARRRKIVKENALIQDNDAQSIIRDLSNKVYIPDSNIGKISKNGKLYTYERGFCKRYAWMYNVTEQYIYRIITGKTNHNVQDQ